MLKKMTVTGTQLFSDWVVPIAGLTVRSSVRFTDPFAHPYFTAHDDEHTSSA